MKMTEKKDLGFTCPKCGSKNTLDKITKREMERREHVLGVDPDNSSSLLTKDSGLPLYDTGLIDEVYFRCSKCDWDTYEEISTEEDMAKWIADHQ
jgi:hypothetical protein